MTNGQGWRGVLAGKTPTDSLSGHNQNVEAGSLTKIIDRLGTFKVLEARCFYFWDLLEEVDLPYLSIINSSAFSGSSILYAKFENLEELSGGEIFADTPILSFYAPNLVRVASYNIFTRVRTIRNIVVGKVNIIPSAAAGAFMNLRNYQVGEGLDIDVPLSIWTATNVINEEQGIDELNENLYNNLLTKLYDHSTDGQTRTLRLGWLAHVSQENIDYANSKGWTLTT